MSQGFKSLLWKNLGTTNPYCLFTRLGVGWKEATEKMGSCFKKEKERKRDQGGCGVPWAKFQFSWVIRKTYEP